jgi:hypothetical protein
MDQGYCEKAWVLKRRWPATTLPGLSYVNTEYVLVNRLFDVPAAQAKADAPIHMYLRRILRTESQKRGEAGARLLFLYLAGGDCLCKEEMQSRMNGITTLRDSSNHTVTVPAIGTGNQLTEALPIHMCSSSN